MEFVIVLALIKVHGSLDAARKVELDAMQNPVLGGN